MKTKKGIILAGGSGSRLHPLTSIISKQLMLVYDKPMIYYPLSTLMLMGIQEVLIITTNEQLNLFEKLLGNGHRLGISISYKVQDKPEGLAHALKISKNFINDNPVVVILGDNIFHGSNIIEQLLPKENKGATIYVSYVEDPERYGIVEIDSNKDPIKIYEKPIKSKSNLAITGLYYFDQSAINRIKKMQKSKRGEFEITDLLKLYLKDNSLGLHILSRGIAWFDTGTFNSLFQASSYVKALEKRQGLKICFPEEIAWRKNWINEKQLLNFAKEAKNSDYAKYIKKIVNENIF